MYFVFVLTAICTSELSLQEWRVFALSHIAFFCLTMSVREKMHKIISDCTYSSTEKTLCLYQVA